MPSSFKVVAHNRCPMSKEVERAIANSVYTTFEGVKTYLMDARFENPKETTKFYRTKLAELTDPERQYSLADIGCASGEMIHHFRKLFPHWQYAGFDINPDYIAFAAAQPSLARVPFQVADIHNVEGAYDIVCFLGTITIFWDYTEPLNKLLSLCRPGALILVDGYFSADEIELRTSYMDKSRWPGIWRRDWSIFTRSGLREFLADKSRSVEFYEVPMGIDLTRNSKNPHINAWTFKDESGRRHLTNGTHLILDDVLMVIRK